MFRFYLGIAICMLTIPMNHFDWFFSEFTDFSLFGNNYSFVKPFTSTDIIWTIIQKTNILLFTIGGYLITTGLMSLLPDNMFKFRFRVNIAATVAFSIIGLFNVYQSVSVASMYINGFQGKTTYFMMLIMLIVFSIVIGLFIVSLKVYKNSLLKVNRNDFNNKLENISFTVSELIEDVRDVELISEEANENDNLKIWKVIGKKQARTLYKKIDKLLKEIDAKQN